MAQGIEVAVEVEAVDALLNTSGIQVQVFATDPLTSIRKGVTKLRTFNVRPDVLIVNLADAEALDLTQDLQNRFYFGGPANSGFTDDRGGVWAVPTIQTAAVPAGTAILANVRQAARGTCGATPGSTWTPRHGSTGTRHARGWNGGK